MTTRHDLAPAAEQVGAVADAVGDDQLRDATPCEAWTVADLLGHLLQLTSAFTAAATKAGALDRDPLPNGQLPAKWRLHLRDQLDGLVAAWRAPESWEGEADAGGVVMPAEAMGVVALDELVLHGWDLARATGQPFRVDPASVQACLGFAAAMSEPGQEAGREGLYGPVVPVASDAADLDRLLGYAGRNPRWDRPRHG